MGSEESLAEILRFDRDGDHAAIFSYFQSAKIGTSDALFVLYQLLTTGRFQSAYAAAKALSGSGSANPVIDLALSVGGALFGDAGDEAAGSERLAQTVAHLGAAQLKSFEDAVVGPVFRHAMMPEITGAKGDLEAQLHRIHKAASPGYQEPKRSTPIGPAVPGIVFDDPIDAALRPIWTAADVTETLIFLRANPYAPPLARLLFRPERIVRLTSGTLDILYEPDRDYLVDLQSGIVTLPPGSRIPFKTTGQLMGYAVRALPFPPDDIEGFHRQQVEAAYTCAPGQWRGYVPEIAETQLPRTLKTLRAGQPLKILLMGDSIADGGCSTKAMNVSPRHPPFGEQVARALERSYGSAVSLDNVAHGGWSSGTGFKQVADEKLGARHPDLVIVEFGMNDITFANAADRNFFSAANYGKNIRAIVDAIREESPDTEFILVSSMFGNGDSDLFPPDLFRIYRDELKPLTGPGVALADVTAVQDEVLKTKSFFDMTINGVNHPNDFAHRLYAQTILALLVKPAAQRPKSLRLWRRSR